MGSLTTPLWDDGDERAIGNTAYTGFEVKFGGLQTDPIRNYDDINKIFKSDSVTFKTHEEHTLSGTFKSYSVGT